jgi:hypothetical protein
MVKQKIMMFRGKECGEPTKEREKTRLSGQEGLESGTAQQTALTVNEDYLKKGKI